MKLRLLSPVLTMLFLLASMVVASAQSVTVTGHQDPNITLTVTYPALVTPGSTVSIPCSITNDSTAPRLVGLDLALKGGTISISQSLPPISIPAKTTVVRALVFVVPPVTAVTVLTGTISAPEVTSTTAIFSFVPVTITVK